MSAWGYAWGRAWGAAWGRFDAPARRGRELIARRSPAGRLMLRSSPAWKC